MTIPMWTPLPAELIHNIFAYLSDDKSSLESCSLVCSAWVPLTGSFLFRHIFLNCKALVSGPSLQPAYFSIKDSLRITRNVREVTLTDNDGHDDKPPRPWAGMLDHIPLTLVGHIATIFPALRHMRIVDLEFTAYCEPRVAHIDFSVSERCKLERLDLQFVPQTFFLATLDQFLSLFEDIEQLYIEDRWRPGCSTVLSGLSASAIARPAVFPTCVQSLTLRNRGDSDLFSDVLKVLVKAPRAASQTGRTEHLALYDYRPVENSASAINKFLLEAAGGLRRFECHILSSSVIAAAHRAMMSEAGYDSAGLKFPALRMCKNIQAVKLTIPIFCITCYPNLGTVPRVVWEDALAILLFPPPNTLRHIDITLNYIRAPMSVLLPCCLDAIDRLDRSFVEKGVEHHADSLEAVGIIFRSFSATPLHRQAPSIEVSKYTITERYKQSRFGKLFSVTF